MRSSSRSFFSGEHEGHAHRDPVQQAQGHGQQALGHGVGGGQKGADHEGGDDRAAPMLEQGMVVDDAHARQEGGHDGQLEDRAEDQQHLGGQAQILAEHQLGARGDAQAEVDQVAVAKRQHHVEAKRRPAKEEQGGHDHKRRRDALLAGVQPRGDEPPQVVQRDRRGGEDAADHGDLEHGEERLGQVFVVDLGEVDVAVGHGLFQRVE